MLCTELSCITYFVVVYCCSIRSTKANAAIVALTVYHTSNMHTNLACKTSLLLAVKFVGSLLHFTDGVKYKLTLLDFVENPQTPACKLQVVYSPNSQNPSTLDYFLFGLDNADLSCGYACGNISFYGYMMDPNSECGFDPHGSLCAKHHCVLPYSFELNRVEDVGR